MRPVSAPIRVQAKEKSYGTAKSFVWGVAGSFAIEVVYLARILGSGRPIPRKVRTRSYWIVRSLLGVVAGLVTVAFQAQAPIVAMEIGVATPFVVDSWVKRRQRAAVLPSQEGD